MLSNAFSYWQKNFFVHNYDVAIIGAGINGLLAAVHLKKAMPNLSVAIFEKGNISNGATNRNAGFACFGSITELEDDSQFTSKEEVLQVLNDRYQGLEILKSLVGESQMRFEPNGGYEFFKSDELHQYQASIEKIDFWNKEIQQLCGLKNTFSPFQDCASVFGFSKESKLIKNPYEGSIYSNYLLNALYEIVRRLDIAVFFGCELEKYTHNSHTTDLHFKNELVANTKRLLFCTNGYLPNLQGLEDVKPARGQVLITQPIEGLKLKGVFHHQFGYNYFRNLDNRVLLGGGRFLDFDGETTTEHELNEKIQDYLEGLLFSAIIPSVKVKIDMRWSGIMAMGSSKKPIIKKLEDRVYFAGRMGGMGVALAAHSGHAASKLITEEL